MFFQNILLSSANNDSIPTKYAKNKRMLPNRSVEKFNQFGYMLVLTMLDNVKEYSSKIPYIHDIAVF